MGRPSQEQRAAPRPRALSDCGLALGIRAQGVSAESISA
jgi:hypothetical protein